MLITTYSPKGGVGKTSISFFLSHYLKCYYKTNDTINSYVPLEIYPKVLKEDLTLDIIKNDNVVFDCGGFIDTRLEEVIENSDFLLVPLDCGINSKMTISRIKESFESLLDKDKIIYIINNYKNKDKLETTKNDILSLGINEKNIIGLKSSEIFENGYEKNKCLIEISNENNFNKYIYKNIIQEWKELLNRIEK
jgi:cellulose biosynthesis protein BcsQ